MYAPEFLSEQIRKKAKEQNISQKDLLTKCNLGINTLSKLSKGNDILVKNLVKIAETLNCSIDYLVGNDWIKRESNYKLSQNEIVLLEQFRQISSNDKAEILALLEIKIKAEKKEPLCSLENKTWA